MNYELEQSIRTDLRGDEKLLWTGQPAQGVRFRAQDVLLVPFSLLWGGFAVFWEWGVLQSKAPGFFALWGVPFVGIGLYLIIGRFFVDAAMRARTCYGLTSQRAIILSGLFTREIRSIPLDNMADITLKEGSDNQGTITLGAGSWRGPAMVAPGWPGASRYLPPMFDMIDNPRNVYDLLMGARKSLSSGSR